MSQKPIASHKFHAGMEKSKKEEQEYGPGKKGFTVCRDCNAVYYHKSWHHGFTDYKHLDGNERVDFTICPACQMIKDGKCEGKVVFENVPEQYKASLINNIRNTGQKEFDRDPMDRVVKVKSQKSKVKSDGWDIEVLTTENQLARNIARQVERAFKGAKSEVQWSKEESIARIVVRFNLKS